MFRFSPQGKFLSKFGEEGDQPGQFRAPQAIAVDNQGRLYVSDIHGVQVFSSDGRYLQSLQIPSIAFGMVFDSNNNLYIAGRDYMYKYALNG